MSTLTDQQKKHIQDAIRDHHLIFMAEVLGPDSIPKEDYARLKSRIRTKKVFATADAATAAHVLGAITGELPPADASKLSSGSLFKILKEAPPVLSAGEREAITIAKTRLGEHIRGLGNKLDSATGHVLVDHDDKLRKRNLGVLRREVARGIEQRSSVKEIATAIQQATKDSKRNWLQIAQTEVHNAVEEGKAIALVKAGHSGDDPLVYKRPRPDACPFCVLLYLKPDKKTPRVFKLSELMANGTNVGRKANRPQLTGARATEWKAVLGAMHPWCGCTLHHMPEGMGFNSDGEMVYVGTKKSIEVESLNKAYASHICQE